MLQGSFSTDVLFLGAGFSRAVTNHASPLMGDFFATLDGREYWLLSKFLEECFGSIAGANVEDAMLKLDQLAAAPFRADVDAFIGQCKRRHADLKKELYQYVVSRLCGLKPTVSWAANVLFWCSDSSTVITSNYDTVAEQILSRRPGLRHSGPDINCHHCRMGRVLRDGCECNGPRLGDVRADWKGLLVKLHGSVAWRSCRSETCSQHTCLTPHPSCKAFKDDPCECCGGPCDPVVILPSMQKRFEEVPEMHRMWDAAFRALSEAKRVIFFGFSFPRSDAVISEMMRCTLGRSKLIERIAVVDTDPVAPVARLQNILPNFDKITIDSLVVPGDLSVPHWFSEWQEATGTSRAA